MKVHHLNCATFCPRGGRLFGDSGRWFEAAKLVCHCLLLETESSGLVLIDTGFGTHDIAHPLERLGPGYGLGLLPRLDVRETAYHRIRDLGFSADDVQHILLTHLDADHAGGLADFPRASVHLLADEHSAAHSHTGRARLRYRPAQWAHGVNWEFYAPQGERWFGFDCVRRLRGLPPEILFVPLRGHSFGHTAVAVSGTRGWLLHAGDAYFHHGQLETPDHCPRGLRLIERALAVDVAALRHNQQRLRDLAQERGKEVSVFCAHDPLEFERLQARERARTTNGDPRHPLRADV
jgi:glyoxylase-like metal-dependent hydrolase (beta-lactamase superfamily II)